MTGLDNGMSCIVTLTPDFLLATQLTSSRPSCYFRAVFALHVARHVEWNAEPVVFGTRVSVVVSWRWYSPWSRYERGLKELGG